MKSRLCFFAFFISLQCLSAQGWTTLDVTFQGRYDDIYFLNDSLGWACGNGGIIQKTTDGGQSWTTYVVDQSNYLRSIEFMNADTGFCGAFEDGQFLFRTTDGGQTWTDITSQVPGLPGGVCGLSCPDGNVVYGCGVWHTPAFVVKSTDGGLNWQLIDMSAFASALVDIHFINQDTGWVSGLSQLEGQEGGVILYTKDGGQTWETVHNTHQENDYVWKLQRLDESHWFASIERSQLASVPNTEILKSSNGRLWVPFQVSQEHFRLQMVGFLTPMLGWTGNGYFFETTDGGSTWEELTPTPFSGGSFNRFFKINDQKAFMTGRQIYRYDATSSPTKEPKQQLAAEDFHGLTVSPNPARDQVEIRIELRQKTYVVLKIFDFQGKLIQTLWTGEHGEGDYVLQPDIKTLPAGTYVVYFKTHHGTQSALFNKL